MWRHLSATLAIIYGLLLAFISVEQHSRFGAFHFRWGDLEAVLAIGLGVAVFYGLSTRLILLAFLLKAIFNSEYGWLFLSMLAGRYSFAGNLMSNVVTILILGLPFAVIFASLIADPIVQNGIRAAGARPLSERN